VVSLMMTGSLAFELMKASGLAAKGGMFVAVWSCNEYHTSGQQVFLPKTMQREQAFVNVQASREDIW
jgi:hypothetical protein